MARPREFDPDTALTGAMDIFWRQGYKATNLPDLLDAMGLTRGSFYKAFTDKEAVYLQALDHYDRVTISSGVEMLGACDLGSASACLAQLFAGSADPSKGCFLCNAIVELAPHHPAVAKRTQEMTTRLRGAIHNVLMRYGGEAVSEDTADLILHLYFGHQALGKAGKARQDWEQHLAGMLNETGR